MAQLTIELTDAAGERLRERAAQAGYPNGAAFLAALVEADADDDLDRLLVSRFDSGQFVPVTDAWFDDVRRRAGLPTGERRVTP